MCLYIWNGKFYNIYFKNLNFRNYQKFILNFFTSNFAFKKYSLFFKLNFLKIKFQISFQNFFAKIY